MAIPDGMIPIEKFAEQKKISVDKVINMIKDGFYTGRKIDDNWFIDNSELEEKNTKTSVKEKQLPLAIGLNLLFPGVGYMYMGKWIVGIFALLLILGIFATTGAGSIGLVWLSINIIMAIDMYILFKKNKDKQLLASTMKCPLCAETIKKKAKICRFCNSNIEEVSA